MVGQDVLKLNVVGLHVVGLDIVGLDILYSFSFLRIQIGFGLVYIGLDQ